jgi:hypothetical protein
MVIRSSLDDKNSVKAFLRSADMQLIRLILITRIADQSSRHSVVFQDSTSSGSRGKRVKRADRLAKRPNDILCGSPWKLLGHETREDGSVSGLPGKFRSLAGWAYERG